MSRTIAFSTLGCKLNQYETDSIATQFTQAGYTIVPFEEKADIYVINTCTVTNKADRKSRNIMYRALRSAAPDEVTDTSPEAPPAPASKLATSGSALQLPEPGSGQGLVVVTGCFVDNHKEALEKEGRVFVLDNDQKANLFQLVDAWNKGEVLHPEELEPARFKFGASEDLFHTRATLKIQDGCDNFCTFCIIPFVRGRAVSRPVDEILTNARELLRMGYKELVLTGVNMSRYLWKNPEDEAPGTTFSQLLGKILNLPGDFRLRISSMEPDQLDEGFFALLSHPKMAPHLHLCLQSGSERILLKMRRQYTRQEYVQLSRRIRAAHPDFNLTTDVIVGFPGETDAEFNETIETLKDINFGHIHTFKYSVRQGTRAERMPDHIPEKTKTKRSEMVRRLAESMKREYRNGFLGKNQKVLVEKVTENGKFLTISGLGEHYIPVEFTMPRSDNSGDLVNNFFTVKISKIGDGEDPVLYGTLID